MRWNIVCMHKKHRGLGLGGVVRHCFSGGFGFLENKVSFGLQLSGANLGLALMDGTPISTYRHPIAVHGSFPPFSIFLNFF